MWHICTLHNSLQKANISTKTTKNHQKSAIFRRFKFLKTHKSSFKNGLIFVFHLIYPKAFKTSKFNSIFKNRQVGFCHASRSLCSDRFMGGINILSFNSCVLEERYFLRNRLYRVMLGKKVLYFVFYFVSEAPKFKSYFFFSFFDDSSQIFRFQWF